MIEFDTESFREALEQELPVVVDFWAPWCMPCKIFAPALEELADEMDGTAAFGKVNVDEYGQLAVEYDISSIPTVIVFKKGEPVERIVGVRAKEEVKESIDKHI